MKLIVSMFFGEKNETFSVEQILRPAADNPKDRAMLPSSLKIREFLHPVVSDHHQSHFATTAAVARWCLSGLRGVEENESGSTDI